MADTFFSSDTLSTFEEPARKSLSRTGTHPAGDASTAEEPAAELQLS
jgi:hypothetical protein